MTASVQPFCYDLGSDAVFGVRDCLIVGCVQQPPGSASPDGRTADGAWARVRFDIRLAAAPSEKRDE